MQRLRYCGSIASFQAPCLLEFRVRHVPKSEACVRYVSSSLQELGDPLFPTEPGLNSSRSFGWGQKDPACLEELTDRPGSAEICPELKSGTAKIKVQERTDPKNKREEFQRFS